MFLRRRSSFWRVRRDAEALLREKALLAYAVLRDGDTFRGGCDACCAREEGERRRWNVLEFRGGRARQPGKLRKSLRIEVVGANVPVGHAAGRTILAGIQHRDLVAQALRGHAEHPAELAAAQESQPRTWRHDGNRHQLPCRRNAHRAGGVRLLQAKGGEFPRDGRVGSGDE